MSHYGIEDRCYHVIEAGSGDPLLLLHGFTGDAATWRPLMDHFAAHFRVIAIDLPGHGQTVMPADITCYTMDSVSADIARLLASMKAWPAHCLGYSMGGRLALYTALSQSEAIRSLILESASPGLSDAVERDARREQDELLAARIERLGIPSFVDYWQELPLFRSQTRLPTATRRQVREQRLSNSAAGLAMSLRGMGTSAQPELWTQLHKLQVPTLLVAGEFDEKFVALNRRMVAGSPCAKLCIVAGAGHAVHLEQPQRFAETVLDFLLNLSQIDGQELADAKQCDEHKGSN